ncbi:MAG: type II toxin-antitoxin system Phd/YefM family antitoxin [Methylococcales bacterium]|jgi:prevent-host-death family protein|nr:type II toxin-antitoxin system Phd/YefM family antitoxin [Methylococcales bacterium]MBT7445127.1 type II toxin-antitoxin system Phd/YefM family antitoxin [Methylococcales bacterium]
MSKHWQLQQAKSQFSQLVDKAMCHEPQIVTKHGDKAVVVLSYDDYQALLKPKTDLVDFLRASPLMGLEFSDERDKQLPRDIVL